MIINNTEIKPGENKTIKLDISKLASGTVISIQANVFRSQYEGPTVLITGGVHGDEINGVEIVRRAVAQNIFNELKCGTVITIPIVNIYGFINFSRELPDGKDVNRSFPGSKKGSLASRVANILTKEILPIVDLGLDFHTGGSSIYNFPQVRAYKDDQKSLELANVFNAPLLVETGLISKSFRKEAFRHNVPMIVFEGGESLRIDEFSINEGIKGIKKVLNHYQMINEVVPKQDTTVVSKHKWIRAATAGVFLPKILSGQHYKKGDVLGVLTNPYNQFEKQIIAKEDGFVFGHDNKPVINEGKALFHIGS
ncbi:MAG: succinylglutamate desuccinylase/aspartoacylase family protein [Putridiphycobacter sp.]